MSKGNPYMKQIAVIKREFWNAVSEELVDEKTGKKYHPIKAVVMRVVAAAVAGDIGAAALLGKWCGLEKMQIVLTGPDSGNIPFVIQLTDEERLSFIQRQAERITSKTIMAKQVKP